MRHEDIFSKIDELFQKYVDVLVDVCNIESPTNDKAGVDECGRYFINLAKEKGWKVEVIPEEVSGDVVFITMNPDAKGKPVSLSGHIDTVHKKGLFGYPPVRRDDKCIYGPGTTDCKGGVVAGFFAMDALSQCGFTERPVQLLIQSDEEKSSMPSGRHTIHSICKRALGSVAFLNLEGMNPDKREIIVGRKGILRFLLTVHGFDVHSSFCYDGANAVSEACSKIIKLEEYKNPTGLTINCGVIKGGTVPNTVAKECEFFADIRFSTPEEMQEAREIIDAVAKESLIPGTSCTVEEVSSRPPMVDTPDNYALAEKMNVIFEKCGLPRLEPKLAKGGADSAYSTEYGIPSVDSVGTSGGYIHTAKEYTFTESLRYSAKMLASTVAFIED